MKDERLIIHCGSKDLVILVNEKSIDNLRDAIKYFFIENKIDATITIK